jgi:ferritin
MLSKKIEKALNKQINYEFYSAHLYLSMASYFKSIDLDGFGRWMQVQYEEEIFHAMKLLDFIHNRDGKVKLLAIDQPPHLWKSPLDVFTDTYTHEQKVTGLINDLVTMSIKENDHATQNFLQWYIAEQVEEEANVKAVKSKLQLAADSTVTLLMLDQEMAKRVFTPPQN